MRSVVAEASSIAKAIELAWQKAGQPKEFLTKVFQEPQRNIFGLTKTTAKVGIFFDDVTINHRIKNASQSTQPVTHSAKPTTQISNQTNKPNNPNKVAQPKIQAPKAQAPKVQAPKPQASRPARPAQAPKQHIANKTQTQAIPAETISTAATDTHVNQTLVVQTNTQNQVMPPITKPVTTPENAAVSTENTNINMVPAEQRPARSKYYRRRKQRSPRPNTGDNSSSDKPNAHNNPVIKHED